MDSKKQNRRSGKTVVLFLGLFIAGLMSIFFYRWAHLDPQGDERPEGAGATESSFDPQGSAPSKNPLPKSEQQN